MQSVELTVQRLGLVPTGIEDYYSPRRQYIFEPLGPGAKNLTHFFDHPINQKNTIWLTPCTVEDLLIFYAFSVEDFKAVYFEHSDGIRTPLATNDDEIINHLRQAEVELYVNPKLFLPSH